MIDGHSTHVITFYLFIPKIKKRNRIWYPHHQKLIMSNHQKDSFKMQMQTPPLIQYSFLSLQLVKRHAAEIFTSITIATLFSLYSTALLGRLVALEPTLTISILPRCITVALALSIVSLFEGQQHCFKLILPITSYIHSGYLLTKPHVTMLIRCQFITDCCCCRGDWSYWSKLRTSCAW